MTIVTAYALFALAEVGLEIENVSYFLTTVGYFMRASLLIAMHSLGEKDRTTWTWIAIVNCYA